MKNNFWIINFLRKLFRVFLWLSIVNIAIVVFVVSMDFFSSSEKSGDRLPAIEEEDILNEISSVDVDANAGWIYKYSGDADSTFHISHPFEVLLFSILVLLMFYHSHKFFIALQKGIKTGCFFFKSNYFRIKKIGFLLLAMVLYTWIKECVLFGMDFIGSISSEEYFSFTLDSTDLSSLVTVLIIFVFAEVYRAGIEMKEETDLTI